MFHVQPLKGILSKINIILITNTRLKSPQGCVNEIVDKVKKGGYNIVIIDPSGKDSEARPWKTGYYHIGVQLGWNYRVLGLDFESKCFKIGPIVSLGLSLDSTQELLQKHMSDIVPLYEKYSVVKIKSHNKNMVGIIDKSTCCMYVLWIICVIIIVRYCMGNGILPFLYGTYLQGNNDITVRICGMILVLGSIHRSLFPPR